MNIIGLENAFAEFKIENIIKISTPDEFFKIQAKENKSYYEILPNIIKPFFDIENVSDEKEVFILIEAIKETFLKCFDFKITDYVLTKNEHSSNHNGLSYHLIIQKCKIEMNVLRRFVKNELKDFIIVDSTIYTKNRLFRTINSYGIAKNTIKDLNSVHYLYKCYQNNKLVFDKDDVEDEAPCGFLAGFKDILNNNFKNMTFISYLDNISDENILKANIETERKWTSLEQDKMNSKKHINHRIVTYSRNYLNLSNLEIKDGNIIIPL